MRKVLAVLTMCLGLVVATPVAASAAPALIGDGYSTNGPSINLRSDVFAKSTGGVAISYWCNSTGGNTQVQIVSSNELTAHRTWTANCNGATHDLGPANAPSNTAIRVRIHNYSGQPFTGGFGFACEGWWV